MNDKVFLLFEFRSPQFENKAVDFSRGKILVGRSPVCDFVINDDRISSFHSLITFNNHGELIIYDLESKNGIFFEDERVQAYKLEAGVRFSLADINLRLSIEGNLDVALHMLQEQTREIKITELVGAKPSIPQIPSIAKTTGKKAEPKYDMKESLLFDDGWKKYHFYQSTNISELYYPLENKSISLDRLVLEENIPSESIERGGSEIFGLEVMTSIGGVVIDIRNYPLEEHEISLTGEKLQTGMDEIFFPTVKKEVSKKFISIKREGILLFFDTEGEYHLFSSDGKKIEKKNIETSASQPKKINQGEIYCLSYENIQIFIRIKSISKGLRFAPVFGRDKTMLWQLAVGIIVATVLAMTLTNIDIPVREELKREVAVIYKQTQNKVVVEKPDTGTPEQKKSKPQKQKEPKKKPEQKPVKQQPVNKNPVPDVVKPKFSFMKKSNLKSFISSKDIAKGSSKSTDTSKKIDFSQSADVSYADESVDVDEFSTGKESSKWNKQGFGGKGGYKAAAFSKKTVVLGAIDPEAIRKALARYLSQFRACYQEELDLKSEDLQGIFDFQFRIGASGRVTTSSLSAHGENFSENGINCMKRVLGKIQFPIPKGGGVVDIKQTFNFSSSGI